MIVYVTKALGSLIRPSSPDVPGVGLDVSK